MSRAALHILAAGLIFCAAPASAEADASREQLKACLEKADASPDDAAAQADLWMQKGGGEPAQLCRAFAQFNRGEFVRAAQDFAALAARRTDAMRAAVLHAKAGLAWSRANDFRSADAEYTAALKLETQDPDMWIDRAIVRASAEKFWDAISDLNQALKIMPDMPEALRLRGQVWMKLNMPANAKADFTRALQVEDADKQAAPGKKQP